MTWYAKNTGSYIIGSIEADSNATEAMNILMNDFGWSFAACCGLFGNIDSEGGWNPWRWQDDNVISRSAALADHSQGSIHGYGLIGWTPAGKYQFNNHTVNGVVLFPNYDQESYYGYGPNWSDVSGIPEDGAAQIRLIGTAMARNSGNIWIMRKNCSASRFITLQDPREAAYYWLYNAEFPEHVQDEEQERMSQALAWYEHLGGGGFGNPLIAIMKKISDRSRGLY